MTVWDIKSDPFQPSASQQLPAAKGAGGRGEAFKSAVLVQPYVAQLTACRDPLCAWFPPVQIRVQLFVYTSLLKKMQYVTLVTFARACRKAVLLECGFPYTKPTSGTPKCCFT